MKHRAPPLVQSGGEANMASNKKCAHPACHCQAREGSNYCSAYCEGEGGTADIVCNCGHPACNE